MLHNKTNIGTLEGVRINLNHESEVEYWTKKLNCSREELEKAIKAVGTLAENVMKFLR